MEPFLDKTDHKKVKPALIKPNAFIKIGKDTVEQKLGSLSKPRLVDCQTFL